MKNIEGFYHTFGFSDNGTPAPAVQARWYFPSLKIGSWVTFLVDSGASQTTINGIQAETLQKFLIGHETTEHLGLHGTCDYYNEPAELTFLVDNRPIIIAATIGIQKIEPKHKINPIYEKIPCLLGRDILKSCKLYMDISKRVLVLELHNV
jgi:hypothetical protein